MKTVHLAFVVALAACAQTEPVPVPVPVPVSAPDVPVVLSGDMESPPVQTAATGRALIVVNEDGTVSGVVESVQPLEGSHSHWKIRGLAP